MILLINMGEKIFRLSKSDLLNETGLDGNKLYWHREPHEWDIERTLEVWKGVHTIIKKGEIAKIHLDNFGSHAIEQGGDLSSTLHIFAATYGLEIETAIGGNSRDEYFLYVKNI